MSPKALHNHLIELTPDLSLLTPGQGPISARRGGELFGHFAEHGITAVVDVGRIDPARETGESGDDFFCREIVERADKSVLVTRACYLSLSKIVSTQMRPSQVVLVAEAGRALTRKDCEQVISAPVAATVAVDPAVARTVDAGMLRTKVPNQAIRALGPVVGQPSWHTPTIRLAPEVEFD